jgi:predicted nucleotidyltransferase
MKTSAEIERTLKKNIQNLKKDYNLNSLGIFGSFVKGEQNQDSDLDILVDFEKPIGLLKFIKLENDLSKILGIKVDLVMKKALKPNIGKRILEEIRYVS